MVKNRKRTPPLSKTKPSSIHPLHTTSNLLPWYPHRDDDTPISIAAAVAYTESKEAPHTERALGKTAIETILKPRSHPGQPFSLSFNQTSDNLLSLHKHLSVTAAWAPRHKSLVGFARGCHLTDTFAWRPLPSNHREPLLHRLVRSTLPPSQTVSCPCGAPLQPVDHVVSQCTLSNPRQEILRPIDRDSSLPVLLSIAQGSAAMAPFLQTTGARMAPGQAWNPDPLSPLTYSFTT
jgi:hypothetical protein